jgi:hypothetical protein
MPPVGLEPTIPARARPQTYALDRAAIRSGVRGTVKLKLFNPLKMTVSPTYLKIHFVPRIKRTRSYKNQ